MPTGGEAGGKGEGWEGSPQCLLEPPAQVLRLGGNPARDGDACDRTHTHVRHTSCHVEPEGGGVGRGVGRHTTAGKSSSQSLLSGKRRVV